jgi:hypothetical protein
VAAWSWWYSGVAAASCGLGNHRNRSRTPYSVQYSTSLDAACPGFHPRTREGNPESTVAFAMTSVGVRPSPASHLHHGWMGDNLNYMFVATATEQIKRQRRQPPRAWAATRLYCSPWTYEETLRLRHSNRVKRPNVPSCSLRLRGQTPARLWISESALEMTTRCTRIDKIQTGQSRHLSSTSALSYCFWTWGAKRRD